MGEDSTQWGSEADATPSSEYCQFCYQGGAYTNPEQTVDGMVQSSIDFMTSELGFGRDQAEKLSKDIIPGLRRWN